MVGAALGVSGAQVGFLIWVLFEADTFELDDSDLISSLFSGGASRTS